MSHYDPPVDMQEMVEDFHLATGVAVRLTPSARISERDLLLRLALMDEEHQEVREAILEGDIAHIAKELADLLYVVFGTAITYGIDLGPVFEEVHRSNMSKLGDDGKPLYSPYGKVLKGPNFSPANVQMVLFGDE